MLHSVVSQTESFLHGKSSGVQKLQKHFNISAHDTVQDNVFPAIFGIGGEVTVLFQGIFEYLAVCARKHTAVIVNYKRLEVDTVFFVNVTQCIQKADKSGFSFAFRGENLFQQGELPLLRTVWRTHMKAVWRCSSVTRGIWMPIFSESPA